MSSSVHSIKTIFGHSSKDREENLIYNAKQGIFDELQGIRDVVKQCLECLIYLLNQSKTNEKIEKLESENLCSLELISVQFSQEKKLKSKRSSKILSFL